MQKFPIDIVRDAFPALASRCNATPAVFLDNPAGTQVPARVADAVARAMLTASSNLGGHFSQSRAAEGIWDEAHEAMADMLGATAAREIVIGPCMTALTLHISRSIGRELARGDEIIVTRMDHEGDISPWLHLAQDRGLVVKWLPFNRETWRIEPEDLEKALTNRTRVLALNYASNLTGSINDVATLAAIEDAFDRFGGDILSPRERQEAQMILRGHSGISIGTHLGISTTTVKTHRKNLYSKLGIATHFEPFSLFLKGL